jgi:hypothetical protein
MDLCLPPLTGAATSSAAFNNLHDDFRRVEQEAVNGTDTIGFSYDADDLLTSAGALTLSYDPNRPLLVDTALGQVTDHRDYDAYENAQAYTASFNGTPVQPLSLRRQPAHDWDGSHRPVQSSEV